MGMATKYDENKIVLTPRNFFAEMYKFSMRCLYPCVVPIRYVALYALQSGGYVPSPEWIRNYSKMDHCEAQSLWDVLHLPKEMLIEESDRIFFQRNPGTRNRVRYFVAGPLSSLPREDSPRGAEFLQPQTMAAAVTPDGLPLDGAPLMENPVTSSSLGRPSLGQSLISALRAEPGNRNNPGRTRSPLNKDYEPFLEVETPNFVVDRDGDPDIHVCPDTLEEMLFLVRKERALRLDIIEPEHFTSRSVVVSDVVGRRNALDALVTASEHTTPHPNIDDY